MPALSQPPVETSPPSVRATVLVQVCLAAVLGMIGVPLFLVGANAVQTQTYNLAWRSHATVLFWNVAAHHGIEHYQGTSAIRMGVGLMGFGGMLATWTLALVVCVITMLVRLRFPCWARQLFIICSLACLLTAVVCFYTPWMFGSQWVPTAFVGTVLYSGGVIWWCAKRKSRGAVLFFSAMIALAIAAEALHPGIGAAVCLGFFTAIILLVHGMALLSWPTSKSAE